MNVEMWKFSACLLISLISFGIHAYLRDRPYEIRWLRALTVAVWTGRLLLAILLYRFFPELVRFSDAVNFYYPQTVALIEGGLPYRDFVTHYSPLFHPLLAVGVLLWRSPGAIVVIMLIAEAALLVNILLFTRQFGRTLDGWRTIWLTVSSPVMIYWVGIGGYNSVLIAAFAMSGLLSLARNRSFRAGLDGAYSLLCCKLLGILTWPTLVFGGGSWKRRALPLVGSCLLLLVMCAAGMDTLMPVKAEYNNWSGGNFWFLAAVMFPGLYKCGFSCYLSPLLLLVAVIVGSMRMRHRRSDMHWSPIHLCWIMVAFMLLGRKSMVMYMPMLFPFAVYSLVVSDTRRFWLPLLLLGVLATSEVKLIWLEDMINSRHFTTTVAGALILLVEMLRIGSLVFIAQIVWSSSAEVQTVRVVHGTIEQPDFSGVVLARECNSGPRLKERACKG